MDHLSDIRCIDCRRAFTVGEEEDDVSQPGFQKMWGSRDLMKSGNVTYRTKAALCTASRCAS